MASKTPNYNLNKIDLTDSPPDITVLNENFDTLDSQLKAVSDNAVSGGEIVNEVNTKIGTSTDAASKASLFGRFKDVLTRIGTTSDSASTNSLFGRLRDLIAKIGTATDTGATGTTGTLMGKINALIDSARDELPVEENTTGVSIPIIGFNTSVISPDTVVKVGAFQSLNVQANYHIFFEMGAYSGSLTNNTATLYITSTNYTSAPTETQLQSSGIATYSLGGNLGPSRLHCFDIEESSILTNTRYYMWIVYTKVSPNSTGTISFGFMHVDTNSGGTSIKSQTAIRSIQTGLGSGVFSISPVNPSKCLVILHSFGSSWEPIAVGYILSSNHIAIVRNANSGIPSIGSTINAQWQIVEFY